MDDRWYYRLYADREQSIALFEVEQFDVVDDQVSKDWVVTFGPGSYFELTPKSFTADGFWTRYHDNTAPELEIVRAWMAAAE